MSHDRDWFKAEPERIVEPSAPGIASSVSIPTLSEVIKLFDGLPAGYCVQKLDSTGRVVLLDASFRTVVGTESRDICALANSVPLTKQFKTWGRQVEAQKKIAQLRDELRKLEYDYEGNFGSDVE